MSYWSRAGRRGCLVGFLTHAAAVVHRRWELAARWASVFIDDALRADAQGRGASIVGVAPADERAAALGRYAAAGAMSARHEFAVGANVYLWGDDLVWQTDVQLMVTERGADAVQDVSVRTMLTAGF